MFWQLGYPLRIVRGRKGSVSPHGLGCPGHGVVLGGLCLSTQRASSAQSWDGAGAMGDGGCFRHLWDVPGESRECQPWVPLKPDLSFPKGGFALSQELQNHPPQHHHGSEVVPSVSCRVHGEAWKLEQMQQK